MKKILYVLLGVLLVIGLIIGGAYTTYDQVVNKDVIYDGISINGIDVSGLNKEEALEK